MGYSLQDIFSDLKKHHTQYELTYGVKKRSNKLTNRGTTNDNN